MAITLDEPTGPRIPVMKRQRIGEHFVGALVQFNQRDVLKDGQPVLKDNGKPRQELVVTLVALPGTTMSAGIGQDPAAVPAPGELVRIILRGKSFGDWIEAKGLLGGPLQVGDIVEQTLDHAQTYSASGQPQGAAITDQAALDRVPRGQSVGVYGPLTIRRAGPAEGTWVQHAERAYLDKTATPLEATPDQYAEL